MSNDDNRLHGEEAIIQEYLAPLAAGYPGALGLQDDCAILIPTPGHEIVLKTDPVAEGVHFLAGDDPADIGWKALAVNVSDLAAKAAVPRTYLMALSFPEPPSRSWMAGFASGLAEAQAAFGIALAGGDTDRRPGPITISITVLGEVPAGRMVRRATGRPGDQLYVTGVLGEAALGLVLRRDPTSAARFGIGASDAAAAIARYLRPAPRLAIRKALLADARAAMDLSDGLAKDLGRMAKASGCGAIVRLQDVPLSRGGEAALRAGDAVWPLIAASGDDYEILAAVPPERASAFEAAANSLGGSAPMPFAVTRIGELTSGQGVRLLLPDGDEFVPERSGWDHF